MEKKVKVNPPVYLLISALVMVWLNYIFPFINIFRGNVRYMGVLIAAAGLLLVLISAKLFNRSATPLKPFQKPEKLVTEGVYRFSRNPIYLGMVLILTGLATFLGGLTAFLVIPVFIWAINSNFIVVEEQLLLNTFGKDYADYLSRVRRWI